MKNIDIRIEMNNARVKGYEVASALGIAETSFSRMLARRELSEVEKQKILAVIEELKGEV